MTDRRMTLDGDNISRKEFVYRLPVMSPVSVVRQFWEMDDTEKKLTYAMASSGWKTTIEASTPYEEKADVLVRVIEEHDERGWKSNHVRAWLMPNEYTLAKAPFLVTQFSMAHSSGLDFKKEMYAHIGRALRNA